MQMQTRAAIRLAISALLLLPGASTAGTRYDGDWTTHMAAKLTEKLPPTNLNFPARSRVASSADSTAKKAAPAT